MKRIEKALITVNRMLVAAALAAIFLIVFSNVVGRYVLGSSLAWGEEVARFLMIFGAFAGAGLALREGRLVEIDLFVSILPKRLDRPIRWCVVLVMGMFMALVAWFGIRFVAFGWPKETMATGISRGIPYIAIPTGAVLFICHLGFFARRFIARDFEIDGFHADQDE